MANVYQTVNGIKVQSGDTQCHAGRWTSIGRAFLVRHFAMVVAQCECGTVKVVSVQSITTGKSRSCGCWRAAVMSATKATHGLSKSVEYRTWARIKDRCSNTHHPKWARYGGRGIRVCERWYDDFPAFLEDMGTRPSPKHSIERIDNNGDYSPDNCVWATNKVQSNNRSSNLAITLYGITLNAAQWSMISGVPRNRICQRIQLGWNEKRAVFHPSIRPGMKRWV